MSTLRTTGRLLTFRITREELLRLNQKLNLERAVFNIMGGIREESSADTAYRVLVFLTAVSSLAAGPLLIGYAVAIYKRWKNH